MPDLLAVFFSGQICWLFFFLVLLIALVVDCFVSLVGNGFSAWYWGVRCLVKIEDVPMGELAMLHR